uniref:Filament-like plant protein 7 n=1 Tax=Anthurium amnicola TaxID=1678845 RepID=A0A1D1XMK3_9ARAE
MASKREVSMEHKTWLWRRKPSDKTAQGNQEEVEKAKELERSLKSLSEKLTSAVTESNAKDDLLAKHIKVAEEALEGWERAETEAASFKQELDDALQCKFTAEERISDLETALEECKQQLHGFREEQKQVASDNAMKMLREKEKTRKLEERLGEQNKRLSKLSMENNNLIKALEIKEKVIEDLNEHNFQADAKINSITEKLDCLEKNNATLTYEVCMLEKELQIRNEEKEFNLKSVDAAHKQHLESIKKIAKLESECQRLRVMVRKRLPGPAALAKMRSEVEILGKDTYEMKNKKAGLLVRDFVPQNHSDSNKRASLFERSNAIEEENRILKETLTKRNSELQAARIMCARTASKLSQAETQLEEISKGQTNFEHARSSPVSYDLPLASVSEDGANEDTISCAESWASALITELENFRNGKPMSVSSKTSVVSELNLMDDFVEMEKLAIVCVDKPLVSSYSLSGEKSTCLSPCVTASKHDTSEATHKEIAPFCSLSGINNSNTEIQSSSTSLERSSSWLQNIVTVILQKHHVSQRSLGSILEEVRVTLANMGHSVSIHPFDALPANGNNSQKPQHFSPKSFDREYETSLSLTETTLGDSKSKPGKSVNKFIELIEGINERSLANNHSQLKLSRNEESTVPGRCLTHTGYLSRVFQWRTSELSSVLQHLIETCNNLLHQKSDLEMFFEDLSSTLEWIINHCFSLQDVSSMKDMFKRHCDWYESHSESELEVGRTSQCPVVEQEFASEERKHATATSLAPSACNNSWEEIRSNLHFESRSLENDIMNIESLKNESEDGVKSAMIMNEPLINRLEESEQSISSLQGELTTLKESKRLIEAQIENQKLLNEELDTQLSAAKVELNEVHQKFSSLEVALEDKTNSCEELEATCLELQLQLESAGNKQTPKTTMNHEQTQLRTNWEITVASEKLAECQETILNLGKQLKALASPRDAALFDKVIPTPVGTKMKRHVALLDQMLAEDDEKMDPNSPKTKETISPDPQKHVTGPQNNPNSGLLYGHKVLPNPGGNNFIANGIHASPIKSPRRFYGLDESNKTKTQTDVGALAIVPKRHKSNVSLLRKLLSRKKKENSKKLTLHGVS